MTFYEDAETADDMERQYAATAPLLAVEVLSAHDRVNATMRRVTQLLSRGVQMVWVVDPEARDVSVCRTASFGVMVSAAAVLVGFGSILLTRGGRSAEYAGGGGASYWGGSWDDDLGWTPRAASQPDPDPGPRDSDMPSDADEEPT